MSPDRRDRVSELYHEASGRPPEKRDAFLTEACGEDVALRAEVESLLRFEGAARPFLEKPAAAFAAPTEMRNRRLGPYTIVAPLGAGGMGEVYRARDTKLGRDVAIKILPSHFTSDPERRSRFAREARLLATLNHPHIGAIYGLEEADGVTALVLELVEGPTLADRLERGPLPIAEALTIARQVAEALDAAHEKGIVHRDLKPANVVLQSDANAAGVPSGDVRAKVLDFGLAKTMAVGLSGDLKRTPSGSLDGTADGRILGTPAYMSPEQARGQAVDKRTDIWAFGCVLFEMLTGRRAFDGDTVTDTLVRVLEREPEWAALPPAIPEPVRRLLRRCLEKDPGRRVRDIGDARADLDDAIARSSQRNERPDESAPPSHRLRPWAVAMAAAGVTAGVVGFWPRATLPEPWQNPLANAKFTRLTDFPGTETQGQISPDGRFVAFYSDRDGQFDLWLSQVDTGSFLKLTQNTRVHSSLRNGMRTLGFSRDGSEIWFNSARMIVPLLGGTPRVFLKGVFEPAWSTDGKKMVYYNNTPGDPVSVAESTGANASQVFVGEQSGLHNHNPVWSTDGQWIYFTHGYTDEMDVWRMPSSGGVPERVTQHNAKVSFLAPLDSRTLLYVAPAEDRSGPWLWALDVERKISHRASSGLEQYWSVAASADGRRIVATVANPSASLWTVPLLGRLAEERDVRPFSLPAVRALAPRFRGTALFYLSARGTGDGGTGDGLWRFHDGKASEIWKGSDGALVEPPAISYDGQRVVFTLRRDGKRRLTLMSAEGAGARALAASIDVRNAADWSPDARWIVTGGRDDAQGEGLFKVPVDGGAPVRLATGPASNPVWSPDGTLIVYAGPQVGGRSQLLAVRPDGSPVALPLLHVGPDREQAHRFLPDGTGLVYTSTAPPAPGSETMTSGFWVLDLSAKTTRQVARITDEDSRTFDISPDGKHIVFDRVRGTSDIFLIDLPPR